MIKLVRTNSKHQGFIDLVDLLNAYLKVVDGDDHDFYHQFNSIDMLNHVVVAYVNQEPVACGAFKPYDSNTTEIKRMFTKTDARGKGIASLILKELETWSKEEGYQSCVLETGKEQIDAVSFYKKLNYKVIPNYGQYKDIENSICFKKNLV
ncbi:GNAT family N-acetyltransferase [Seonamhaeicola marinus]|uniref:GNAT family N-acetyltransferase n=1 Tax=Seonamhaeicola marinus TaxID=1912246 RepID=A0A5D0H8P1_9FLAO|nr:GNAT family N-acetyltransferase [Seonamhaeicola marinus]TYA65972.1 GNAT family N-acetyltransferase [Seonamhaeicola marinus]